MCIRDRANIFPSLVFFWFLIFSVPTGILMNNIGRKKTVLLCLIVTFASLLLPIFGDGYTLMLTSFSLLGIGNALTQTSMKPLLSNIIAGEKLASTLTCRLYTSDIHRLYKPVRWHHSSSHKAECDDKPDGTYPCLPYQMYPKPGCCPNTCLLYTSRCV